MNGSDVVSTILESLSSGILVFDLEGRVVYLNPAASAVLRCRREEAQGAVLAEVIGQVGAEWVKVDVVKGGEGYVNREAVWARKDGSTLVVGFTLSPHRDRRGEIIGGILCFREISHVLRLGEEMARAERLASLGMMAAGVAHEIRNPLASLRSTAQLLQKKLDPSEEGRPYLDRMIAEIDRINRLLKAFFDFAKPKRPVLKRVNLVRLLDDILLLLHQQVNQRKIRVEREVGVSSAEVLVDGQQLQQVFVNLIVNAIQAMPNSGTLRLGLSPVGEPGTEAIEVRISDTGMGIKPEDLERIFEPFFTTKSKGTGLGLPIAHRILEEHGGTISVETHVGRGTTFTVHLPLA